MIVLSDHFPREINQELEREKIKVLKITKVPVIIKINENEGVDGDGIHIDEAVGVYGEIDEKEYAVYVPSVTILLDAPELWEFMLKQQGVRAYLGSSWEFSIC